jgi:Zn-dependent M32 family carboxypeptidase
VAVEAPADGAPPEPAEKSGVAKRARKEKDPPPFKPMVTKINSIAKRTIRTGQYESYELSTMIEGEPDPNYSVRESIQKFQQLVSQEVNDLTEEIRKQVEAEK